jgi:acyl-ACP thioesterase
MTHTASLIHITPWTETFSIRSYETGPEGRLTLPNLCNYLQEAAGNHAASLGFSIDDMVRNGNTWVLYRLKISVERFPNWGDQIVVQTWPSGVERIFAYREFRVLDPSGQVLASGTSIWLLINLRTRRPVRVEPVFKTYRFDGLERGTFDDLKPEGGTDVTKSIFHVRKSDLDRNLHVNNTRYISWALESLPDSENHKVVSFIDIIFKAEGLLGDGIGVTSVKATGENDRFEHRLFRESDQKELAMGVSGWNEKP